MEEEGDATGAGAEVKDTEGWYMFIFIFVLAVGGREFGKQQVGDAGCVGFRFWSFNM